jgi:CheY-like chemotaxis protein
MPVVLIVSPADLTPELGHTLLWRSDIERIFATGPEDGFDLARSRRPSLLLLDGGGTSVIELLYRLRSDPQTRSISVAVMTHTASPVEEEALRRAGANLVLSGGVDPFLWDDRLEELLDVPLRREVRIPVRFEVWSRFGAKDDAIEGFALNISVRGMLVETTEPIHVGTQLDLGFALSSDEEAISAVAQVVREGEIVNDRPRSGLEFLILRGGARQRISAFIQQESRRPSSPSAS